MMARLTSRINTAAGGQLELTLHPTATIVPSMQELEGIEKGLIDYAYTGPAFWAKRWPAANLFTILINGLTGMEYYFWMREGGGLELVHKMMAGIKVKHLAFMPTPPEVFLQSKKPLKTLADIKGLKIRTAGDDAILFTRMGASVIMVVPGEVYEALMRGVVDAAQLSYPAFDVSLALHEVVKYTYLSPVRQPTDAGPIMVNPDSWAALTPALQEIVQAVIESEAIRYYADITTKDLKALEVFKAKGVTVEPMSKEIVDEMVRQSEIFYAEMTAKDPMYKAVYDSMRAYQKKIRAAYERL